MPYKKRSGTRNQLVWFLTDVELAFLKANNHLENRVLFAEFNKVFDCEMTYSRMRHFQAQYQFQKQERGEPYTHFEKAFTKAHYELFSVIHIGQFLGRTPKSIQKLVSILNLKRTDEGVKRLRHFRSCSGAKKLHSRIKDGQLVHIATGLHNSFITGLIKRWTGIVDLPQELIEIKRIQLQLQRQVKVKK